MTTKADVRRPAPDKGETRVQDAASDGPEADAQALQELLEGLTTAARGDFSVRLPSSNGTLMGQVRATFNELVHRNAELSDELVRVGRVIGREGRMAERMSLSARNGAWATTIAAVNSLIDDLVRPTTEVARVLVAVAEGDLSQKISLEIEGQPVKGELRRIGTVVNGMVDQLSSFADEVTRVAREVGTEGRLGGQAQVKGVSGTWKDLTESVNFMAGNLTSQVRNIAQVATAVARGDLSQKITVEAKGEVATLAETINRMTDTLRSFADEVTRVAREVGTEGKLGGQAEVAGVSGTWKDLTESVNVMAGNLTGQVRNIAQVATAVARGDLSQKITVEAKGEVATLAETINRMTDTLRSFADEVTRVAREVGTEGKLGGQAEVTGVAGTWKDLTDSVNFMAGNLTGQVRNIAEVTTAVARGDLSQKITVDVKGEILRLKNTINTMVDQLGSFADEVTRVAREVGTEGRLGGQAQVKGVSGTWKDLTDSVNFMASNLTSQVRNIAQVTTAVARGDLSQKITVEAKGEVATLAGTINTMVDQLGSFADEVTRVAREVGTEGRLGGQAQVKGVSGTWKDLTDSVNFMAGNLTSQVRNIAQVTTAVARGDLSQKITVEAKGEVATLAGTINTMVDQLGSFADEVTRVAREVGTEGRLGGQAQVKGVSGTWKDLTDSVNFMAGNLTSQVRNIAQVTTAVARGDLSQKITVEAKGEVATLAGTINTMVDQLGSFADEVTRVAREVGTEGRLGGQAQVKGVSGTWKDLTDSVNFMASNLTSQVRNIAQVATAVARGDLSQKITVEAKGEVATLAGTINIMVDQLRAFAAEVTRVAREVGTEGKLGGQAEVEGVAGTWKHLTDNVNLMASNLTDQVRNIAEVTTAVAGGDLSKKITVGARGEILELKNTINIMVDQLSAFAAEVTRVAREVGTEGKLGGQAEVEGVSGTWKRLTDNVNQLAANLTTQVRAIAEVATAVTKGDLTRSIAVGAQGEVAELKDNINQMIGNLRETTQKNAQQDWLKTNLARIGSLMQGQRDLLAMSKLIMSELTPVVSGQHGAFFLAESEGVGDPVLRLMASYGYKERKSVSNQFHLGEGLVGQAALERKSIVVTQAPGNYIRITSGLGEAVPTNIIVLPVLFEDQLLAVIELASFSPFSEVHQTFLDQLTETIGIVLNTIQANMRTQELLDESQRLTHELQSQSQELQAQQEELRGTNQELEDKAALLAQQNRDIDFKNQEIEQARTVLEEKAQQLALSSKYKSEFLANMSHELRTPLNSILILAKLLLESPQGTLTKKQVEFARTIHASGNSLLSLINDILDLSKIEAGKMDVYAAKMALHNVRQLVEQVFGPIAQEKGLQFRVDIDKRLAPTIVTDEKRLQQILNNLLSNAFKFTEAGMVSLRIQPAPPGLVFTNESLGRSQTVVAFAVSDTGIGVPADKLRLIFEAFQQADGTTNREYGGTGLGLSISRELARLLGGEIHVESAIGQGSTFTLYLPAVYPFDRPGHPVEAPLLSSVPSSTVPEPAGGGRELEVKPAMEPSAVSVAGPQQAPLRLEEPDEGRASDGPDRRVLVVEDDAVQRRSIEKLVAAQGREIVAVGSSEEALASLRTGRFDCLVLDLKLPKMTGFALLEKLKSEDRLADIPVIVYTAKELTPREETRLKKHAETIILKSPPSPERLREEIALLLRRPGQARSALGRSGTRAKGAGPDSILGGKRVLIVDDDVRNVFALTSALEGRGMEVLFAENGRDAIDLLKKSPQVDLVLMDVMMPNMDGYEATRTIREVPGLADLPIVVVTAKVMEEDRAKSLAAGASDFITKPVDIEQLLSLMRVWLHTGAGKSPGGHPVVNLG